MANQIPARVTDPNATQAAGQVSSDIYDKLNYLLSTVTAIQADIQKIKTKIGI
jgi:hypothetical protein